jgi:hypothetical protein
VGLATVLGSIPQIVETGAILAGGWWTYNRFVRNRLDHAHVDFDVGLNFVSRQDNSLLVEVEALLENKGLVRQQLYHFEFALRYLLPGDRLTKGEESIREMTMIPHVAAKAFFFPKDWEYAFMEPGTKQRFSYVTHLPDQARAALVWSRFYYCKSRDTGNFHTAARLFRVPDPDVATDGRRHSEGQVLSAAV